MTSRTAASDALWTAAHAERAALADDLAELDDADWARPSLCGRRVVEEVIAHLTAAASIGRTGPLRRASCFECGYTPALEVRTSRDPLRSWAQVVLRACRAAAAGVRRQRRRRPSGSAPGSR
jgi:hypothetical protein